MTADIDPKAEAIRKFASASPSPCGAGTSTLDIITEYATDPPLAVATLLDALRPAASAPGARVCELGPGYGWLLEAMLDEYPDCALHALDLSPPIARALHDRLGDGVRMTLGDIERLPFAGGAFAAIATCWTLYFMRDIDAALEEIKRCVRPGGIVVAATVAPDHMLEYDELCRDAVRAALGRDMDPDIGVRFDIDSGAPYMRRRFDVVELREWHGEMVLPDVETALALFGGYGPQGLPEDEHLATRTEFARLARERIERDGALRMRRHDGAFVARC